MRFHPRAPVLLCLTGLLLVLAGLLCWREGWDLPLSLALRLHRGDRLVVPVETLTNLGGGVAMIPLALLLGAWMLRRRQRERALWLFATIVIGRLSVEVIKLLVHRPRPPIADRLELVKSWSFPSSHSAGTMMTCLAFAVLAGGRWPAWTLALLAAAFIGWTRIALAVHWPGDVMAGWGIGMLCVGAALRWAPLPSPRSP